MSVLTKDKYARQKRWAKSNPQKAKVYHDRWVKKNPDKMKTYRARGYKKFYSKPANKKKLIASDALRRAHELRALPKWLTKEQRFQMKIFYLNCPAGYQVDHIYPLRGNSSCGLHVPWNLQYLSEFDNKSKGNKLPEEILCI